MSNLPLQPLVWVDHTIVDYVDHRAQGAGVFYRVCFFAEKFRVYWVDSMGGSDGNKEFDSLAELKEWVETEHYPHKMQPYVVPMPTWIDVDERLPESECFYLVRLFDGHRDEHVFVILWWDAEHQQFLEWDAMCEPTHWMPIPEFSTMQNLHKGD